MATNLAVRWGNLEAIQVIGDTLNSPEFFVRNSAGTYVSYTGYTLSSILLDSFDNTVATPTISTSTAIPPNETATVTDGKVSISDIPANLPTKEGEYVLWITKVNDGDATDIETIMRIKYKFLAKKFNL